MTPTMVPVLVCVSSLVIHGLPLVPPVKSAQLNFSWVWLCSLVQLRQEMGALSLSG
jgi:hypothetical protein